MEKSIFTIIEVYDETFSYHSASSHKDGVPRMGRPTKMSCDTRRGWGFINVFARKLLITFLGLGVHCEKSDGLGAESELFLDSSCLQAWVLISPLPSIRLPISCRVRPHSTGGTASRSGSVTVTSTDTDTETDTDTDSDTDGDRATVTVTASVIAG